METKPSQYNPVETVMGVAVLLRTPTKSSEALLILSPPPLGQLAATDSAVTKKETNLPCRQTSEYTGGAPSPEGKTVYDKRSGGEANFA